MAAASKYLTAKDIAKELGLSLSRGYEIVRECRHLVTGRSVRVSRPDFEAWKRRHTEAPCLPSKWRWPPVQPERTVGDAVDPLDVPIKVRARKTTTAGDGATAAVSVASPRAPDESTRDTK